MKFPKPLLLPTCLFLSLIGTLSLTVDLPADVTSLVPSNPASVISPPESRVAHASSLTSHAETGLPLSTLTPTDDFFDMVASAPGVVLVDFFADWCGPCREQGEILHEMQPFASENDASIIKVNVDQHRRLARAFQVSGLPTLLLIKDGRIIERQTGLANHRKIASLLGR